MPTLLLIALAAAPTAGSTWKVSLEHTTAMKLEAVFDGTKRSQNGTQALVFKGKAKVVEAKDGKPESVTVAHPKFGAITVADDSGVAVVRMKSAPEDQNDVQLLGAYLGRLVLADEDREAMSACGEKHQAASEHWLRKQLAGVYRGQPGDIVLKNVKLACKATKAGAKDDLSFEAEIPRGISSSVQMKGKGTIEADTGLWVTTWKLTGAIQQAADPSISLNVSGTFISRFELSR
jgi:hypothetical protein